MSSSSLGTLIARVVDGMVLVATMDHMEPEYQQHAKKILKTLKPNSPARCTIEAGPFYYHYMIEQGVAYLTLCERGYPRRLAFQYLTEVHSEFMRAHGAQLANYSRPYACVSFEPKLSKMRRDYLDPQAPGQLEDRAEQQPDGPACTDTRARVILTLSCVRVCAIAAHRQSEEAESGSERDPQHHAAEHSGRAAERRETRWYAPEWERCLSACWHVSLRLSMGGLLSCVCV